MSKAENFPQDVLIAARRAACTQYDSDMGSYGRIVRGEGDSWPIVKVAARAIIAERERLSAIVNMPSPASDNWGTRVVLGSPIKIEFD